MQVPSFLLHKHIFHCAIHKIILVRLQQMPQDTEVVLGLERLNRQFMQPFRGHCILTPNEKLIMGNLGLYPTSLSLVHLLLWLFYISSACLLGLYTTE